MGVPSALSEFSGTDLCAATLPVYGTDGDNEYNALKEQEVVFLENRGPSAGNPSGPQNDLYSACYPLALAQSISFNRKRRCIVNAGHMGGNMGVPRRGGHTQLRYILQ